jgi:hypothetical protein
MATELHGDHFKLEEKVKLSARIIIQFERPVETIIWDYSLDSRGIWRTNHPQAPNSLYSWEMVQVIRDSVDATSISYSFKPPVCP